MIYKAERRARLRLMRRCVRRCNASVALLLLMGAIVVVLYVFMSPTEWKPEAKTRIEHQFCDSSPCANGQCFTVQASRV